MSTYGEKHMGQVGYFVFSWAVIMLAVFTSVFILAISGRLLLFAKS